MSDVERAELEHIILIASYVILGVYQTLKVWKRRKENKRNNSGT